MHTVNTDIGECIKWSLIEEVKNNGKLLTVRLKKWSQSLTGGGHVLQVSTVRRLTGKILVIWIGGRLWEVHMEVRL